jgi:HAD superfamily hydrolase (TIGR01458 family)
VSDSKAAYAKRPRFASSQEQSEDASRTSRALEKRISRVFDQVRVLLQSERMSLPERIDGFLIDLDGTVTLAGELIAGTAEVLEMLARKNIPYRIVTNTTSKPRSEILTRLRSLGVDLEPGQVITAPIIARDYLLRKNIIRCFPLLKGSLLEDLTSIEFVESSPQAVLVGDIGDDLTYKGLNRAFRFILDGAAFITLARNRYFRGPDGLCLDVGSIVAALEYATQREAELIGKPAREFFLLACQSIGTLPERTVMIGDDLEADVGGAQAAGFIGVLVRTGKFRPAQLEGSDIQPDAILDSIGDLARLFGEAGG